MFREEVVCGTKPPLLSVFKSWQGGITFGDMGMLKITFSKILLSFFWLIFAASIGLHFWIGGVVVDKMYDGGQYYFLLRENKALWVPVSQFTYVAHFSVRIVMFGMCGFAFLWASWRWLWHGDVGKTPSNQSAISIKSD